MKYIDEYRDPAVARALIGEIRRVVRNRWTLMEICGGQTHAIVRYGIDTLLPEMLTLVHGPGCPVCVTSIRMIDKACTLARREEVIFTTFGDMIRVPGSMQDLAAVKAGGGDVRIVYSPLDAVRLAEQNPGSHVVFFAVGFETTAPANGRAVQYAAAKGLKNFSILCAHVLVPPALRLILSAPGNCIQGLLAAGHVCTVMGYEEYIPIAERFHVPIVVTGFEPVDILLGILECVRMLEGKRFAVHNSYTRSVRREGNPAARRVLDEVFEPCDRVWRGIGHIPASGLRLRKRYERFDAEQRFDLADVRSQESPLCRAGEILQGKRKPLECPAFGGACTPDRPLGAPMVSAEGACAAYYRYRRAG
ncbi:MAG: hydrogenase formation protein HypD [Bacteroidota bacterium]|nr:hydrogenase formation protein HypD [Bacteroidota bacterium]